MKRPLPYRTSRAMMGWAALGLIVLTGATATAQEAQIISRPLSPQDRVTYKLPTTTQLSDGLFTVGVGGAVYLEAQVPKGTTVSGITWALSQKPATSVVALAPSPLSTNVPSYEPSERLEFEVVGRQLLVPDVKGRYIVTATLAGATNNLVLTRTITAATYVGAGFVDGNDVATGRAECINCHNGGLTEDKITPWSKTGHAIAFTLGINGISSDHFSSNCISCHVLGYDTALTATNGGFDDVAKQLGWTFPTVMTNTNWEKLPMELKKLSNVQCESCHGPGSEHRGAHANAEISVSASAGVCAKCHDSGTHHFRPREWAESRHAIAVREESASCAGCHSGIGYIDRIEGASTIRTNYAAITCITCHDPHKDENPHQLRNAGVVTLMDKSRPGGATTITNGGPAALCMQCHMSRRDAVTYVTSTAGSSRFGPHHGPQTDMLLGVNAVTYGKSIPSSSHSTVVNGTCVTCHMQTVAPTNSVFLHAGGHTFNVSAHEMELAGACQSCHGSTVTSLDFARQDYDGNGVIEGTQTEVKGLLDKLGQMLPPIGDPTVTITAAYTTKQLSAAYNYLFVLEDGSYGVHNTAYAVGLLKASIADLTDDSNSDTLPDSWQITYFGSPNDPKASPNASPSGDGVPNWLKYSLGLDPTVAGQPLPGGVVLANGKTPVNPTDTAGTNTIHIYTAAEVRFDTQTGKSYQLQSVSAISSGWSNVGTPIAGTGNPVSYVTPTLKNVQQYYRVVTMP